MDPSRLDSDIHTAPDPSVDSAPETPPGRGLWGEVVHFSLIALLVVLPIRMFIAQPFIVSGASMENTFHSGEYLIVDQISYRLNEPERGDVIIFRYPRDPSKFFIKRIIGLPGDTVEIVDDTVTIKNSANNGGVTLSETYTAEEMINKSPIEETLGKEEYFVMGDNRNASSDSRAWGVLKRDNIVGRAFVRLFPPTMIDVFPGHENINIQ